MITFFLCSFPFDFVFSNLPCFASDLPTYLHTRHTHATPTYTPPYAPFSNINDIVTNAAKSPSIVASPAAMALAGEESPSAMLRKTASLVLKTPMGGSGVPAKGSSACRISTRPYRTYVLCVCVGGG